MHPYSQATQDLNISGGKISSYLLVFKEITLTCLKIQVYIKDLIQTSSRFIDFEATTMALRS